MSINQGYHEHSKKSTRFTIPENVLSDYQVWKYVTTGENITITQASREILLEVSNLTNTEKEALFNHRFTMPESAIEATKEQVAQTYAQRQDNGDDISLDEIEDLRERDLAAIWRIEQRLFWAQGGIWDDEAIGSDAIDYDDFPTLDLAIAEYERRERGTKGSRKIGIGHTPLVLPKPLPNKVLFYSAGDTNMLYAAPKVGKTGVLAYDCLENAAQGYVSIYISTDEAMPAIEGKMLAYLNEHPEWEVAKENIRLWNKDRWKEEFSSPFDLMTEETVNDLVSLIQEETTPVRAIYIDTLKGSYNGLENDAGDAGIVSDHLNEIARNHHVAIIVAHHAGKNGQQRGSTVFEAAFTNIWKASRDVVKGIVSLVATNTRYVDKNGIFAHFTQKQGQIEDAEGDLVTLGYLEPVEAEETLAEKIYGYISQQMGMVSTADIKAFTGKHNNLVNKALQSLKDDGYILSPSRGFWVINKALDTE